MRTYAKIPSQIWSDTILKKLRGYPAAQVLALYLRTNRHANMLGLYECPVTYICNDTGLSEPDIREALDFLSELGWCSVDHDRDLIWVHGMICDEVAKDLKPKDNCAIGIAKLLASLPECELTVCFYREYALSHHLHSCPELDSLRRGINAPPEPLRCQEQEQDQDQDQGQQKKQKDPFQEEIGRSKNLRKTIPSAQRLTNRTWKDWRVCDESSL